MSEFGIGARLPRLEDGRFLEGRAQFCADIALPGTLHAAFVRSPHAHARIVSGRKPAGFREIGLFRRRSRRGRTAAFDRKNAGFQAVRLADLSQRQGAACRRAGRHGDRHDAGRGRGYRGAGRGGIRAVAAGRLDDGRAAKRAAAMSTRNGATTSWSTSSLRPAISPRQRPLPFTSSSAASA